MSETRLGIPLPDALPATGKCVSRPALRMGRNGSAVTPARKASERSVLRAASRVIQRILPETRPPDHRDRPCCTPRRIAFTAFWTFALAACNSVPPTETVIIFSIDSLRADHVGAYGYSKPTTPTIDRLASQGLRFERAYSTTSWTLPSHASLLSGLDNYAHGAVASDRRVFDSVELLPEQLALSGIESSAFFAGPYLHPSFGLAQGFTDYVDCTSYGVNAESSLGMLASHEASHGDVTNPIVLRQVKAWLEGIRKTEKPHKRRFVLIHLWDVHYDFIAPREYVEMFDPGYDGNITGEGFHSNEAIRPGMPEADFNHLLAQYDAEIRYVDETIGAILSLFETAGMLDRAAVFVLADHGEEFLDHGSRGHARTLHEEVVRIPLTMTVVGRPPASKVSNGLASIVDVAPTVCDLFDVECRFSSDARSLLPNYTTGRSSTPRTDALAELTMDFIGVNLTALIAEEATLIRDDRRRRFELWSRESEHQPLRLSASLHADDADSAPPRLRALIDRLTYRAARAREVGASHGDSPRATPESATTRHLKELGYID